MTVRASLLALAGFAIGVAVLLPLMLIFDNLRPWLAAAAVVCGAAMYLWGRAQRRQRGASRS